MMKRYAWIGGILRSPVMATIAALVVAASFFLPAPSIAGPGDPATLLSAVSRKIHGAAGTFDLALSLIHSNPTTEPRARSRISRIRPRC